MRKKVWQLLRGVADGVPAEGVYLNPTESFPTLTVLNRRYVVQLPRKVQGMVAEQLFEDTAPSDGFFYRKPRPESPNYVEPGSASSSASASATPPGG